MKESKNSKNVENEKIDEFVDKKFEEDLTEIKQKLNAEKLSDEFKEKLIGKLENELNKDSSKSENKIINFPVITRKLAGICACFIFLFTSCFVFADEIENIFLNFFSNTDKIIENAIANGNYKEIDMDYVEDNDVSIKVDYIISEEDCLYIAFNVENGEEYDRIFLDDVKIKNEKDEILYQRENIKNRMLLTFEKQFVNSKSVILLYKLSNLNNDTDELKEININVEKICFYEKEEIINKSGNWKLRITN